MLMSRLEQAIEKYGEIAEFTTISTKTKDGDTELNRVKIIRKNGVPVITIKNLSKWDPSKNNKYLDWILSRKINTSLSYKTLKDFVSFFHSSPSKFTYSDIYKYKDKSDVLNELAEIPNRFSKSEIKKFGAIVVEDNPDYKIIIPKTHLAAKMYGSRTKWCITSDKTKIFDNYSIDNQIYLISIKNNAIIKSTLKSKYHKVAILLPYIDFRNVLMYDAMDKKLTKTDMKNIYTVNFQDKCNKHFFKTQFKRDLDADYLD